jgi:hypothetical protein
MSMALVAAAVAAVLGVVALVPGFDGTGPAPAPSAHGTGVDDAFTCPVRRDTDLGPGNDDDSFLPRLSAGLRPVGEAAGAPRWEVERTARGAVLRLGNQDGTLASEVRFTRTAQGYRAAHVTKCSNDEAVGTTSGDLVMHGLPAPPRDAFRAADLPSGSVRVLDRLTYDVRGLATRHTMWAEPCGRTVCLVAGSRTGYTKSHLKHGSPVPVDITDQLIDPDDAVGQHLGLRLVAVFDPRDTLAAVSWDSYGGDISWVDPLHGGWRGQLFVFLAPDRDLAVVTLFPREGEGHNYQRDDFIG